MNITNSIANYHYNFKPNNNKTLKNYANLCPLSKDTISFGTKISQDEDAINLNWIDDKNVKKAIARIFSDGHARLTRKEILSLLKYFNYELKRSTGDEQYKHKYLDVPCIYTMKAEEPRPAISCTNEFKIAFRIINKTGGELLLSDTILPDEKIESFNATIQDCPNEQKNPYRLKLEAHKKLNSEKENTLLNQSQSVKHNKKTIERSCIASIEEAKMRFFKEYYLEAKNTIQTYKQNCPHTESSKNTLAQAERMLGELLREISSLEYSKGDDNIACQKKIEQLEESLASSWFDISSLVENEIERTKTPQISLLA